MLKHGIDNHSTVNDKSYSPGRLLNKFKGSPGNETKRPTRTSAARSSTGEAFEVDSGNRDDNLPVLRLLAKIQ